MDKRAASTDFRKNFLKSNLAKNMTLIPKKDDKPENIAVDLFGLFALEFGDLQEKIEKALSGLNIKTILTEGGPNLIFKCEKNSVKFTMTISQVPSAFFVQTRKKQGNNATYKEIVNNIYRILNTSNSNTTEN